MSKPKSPWLFLWFLSLAVFMTTLDATALTVALPDIADDLGASSSSLGWIADGYMLTLGSFLLLCGSLGDYFGCRRVLAIGLSVFGVASFWASTASSPPELIAARALMGIGAALIQPATLPTINLLFESESERAKATSLWGTMLGVGALSGPVVGGAVVRWFGWQGIFLSNLPVVVITLVAVMLLMPESKNPSARATFDFGGALLVTIAVATLLFGIIEAPARGTFDIVVFAALLLNSVALTVFGRWEKARASPMLDLRVFKNQPFAHGTGSIALLFFAALGTLFLMTQYFQDVQGHSAAVTGLLLLPYAGALFLTMVTSKKLIGTFGIRGVTTAGGVALTLGIFGLTYVEVHTPAWFPGIFLVMVGAGVGMVLVSSTNAVRDSLPEGQGGVATAANAAIRTLSGAFGIAVIGSVAAALYRHGMDGIASSLPPGVADRIGAAVAVSDITGPAVTELARMQFVKAMHWALYIGVLSAALIVLSARGLPQRGAARALPEPA